MARGKGFSSIVENKGLIVMKYFRSESVDIEAVSRVMEKFKGKILLNAGAEPYLAYRAGESGKNLLSNLIKILEVY